MFMLATTVYSPRVLSRTCVPFFCTSYAPELTCFCGVQGAGYIEFASTEDADKAMALDGKELLGRNIRLDWTN
jgi:hypothetical protein